MTSICTVCSTSFKHSPSRVTGLYCGRKCMALSPVWRSKNSQAKLGKRVTPETRAKMSAIGKGRIFGATHRKRMSEANKRRSLDSWSHGENHMWWKGGKAVLQKGVRVSIEYRQWRRSVLDRDGYRCTECGNTSNLEVHHIIPFSLLLDSSLLFELSNGLTLCKTCHVKTDTYARKPKES